MKPIWFGPIHILGVVKFYTRSTFYIAMLNAHDLYEFFCVLNTGA